jgi:type II secretory ATPase GspE/PulE/Tfp pilus assembly ATPase PilB-like protein
MNCVRCPACPSDHEDSAYWVALPSTGRKESIQVGCPTCKNSFCASCLLTPYHYGCKCDEVMPYTRAWMEWITQGRNEYLKEMGKHEEKYRVSLDEFEAKKSEHEKKVKEIEDRFKDLRANEEELAKSCRMCPKCKRRIFRVSFIASSHLVFFLRNQFD